MGQFWWYVTRSSGIVSWVCATGAVAGGLAGTARRKRDAVRRRWWVDLHQGLGALACTFALLHVVAVLADDFVDFGVADTLVPLWGANGDLGLAAGVLGLYGILTIEVTSLVMDRLPRLAWRIVHETSYALFALVTVHAALIGTDTTNPAVRVLGVSGIAVVVALTALRLRGLMTGRQR